jgi:hypothetical protein
MLPSEGSISPDGTSLAAILDKYCPDELSILITEPYGQALEADEAVRALVEDAKERVVVGQPPAGRQNPQKGVESPDFIIV